MGSNSAADRFGRMALSMEFVARSADRIATDSRTAAEKRNAENAAAVLRCLGTAMDEAQAGYPGALEALAQDAAGTLFSKAFRDSMEHRVEEAAAVPVLAFCGDAQEGE